MRGVIPLNDFYEFLGLEKTELGDAVGWSSCNGDIYWIDFNHHRLTLDDGMEIYVIDMVFEPTAEWMEDLYVRKKYISLYENEKEVSLYE